MENVTKEHGLKDTKSINYVIKKVNNNGKELLEAILYISSSMLTRTDHIASLHMYMYTYISLELQFQIRILYSGFNFQNTYVTKNQCEKQI